MDLRIDVIADTICPWCYLGERRLGQALAARPDLAPSIGWWPFQLNPDMPAEGMDRRTYLERKFGGPQGAEQAYGAIDQAGRAGGIDWDLGRIRRTPSTLDSHRLILWAGRERQPALAQAIYRAFFHEGRDIGRRDELEAIAGSVGLDARAAGAFLASDALAREVRERDGQARELGVTGVPCFVIEGRYMLAGAQSPEALLAHLEKISPQGAMP